MRRLLCLCLAAGLTSCAVTLQYGSPPPSPIMVRSEPDTTVVTWQVTEAYQPPPGGFTRVQRLYTAPDPVETTPEHMDDPASSSTPGLLLPPNFARRIFSAAEIPYRIRERRYMTVTAYNSDPKQTDGTPWAMANSWLPVPTRVASNDFPIGTRLRIRALSADEVFTVEDRMASSARNHVDLWLYHQHDARIIGTHDHVLVEVLGAPSGYAPN